MTAPTTQRDRAAFEVRVDGTALEPIVAADVVEVDVHEEVGRHGRLTLLVQNWDADRRAVRHSDDGPFAPGARIAVSLGYHSELTEVFDGVIASLTTHFPSGSPPVLRVDGRSRSVLMDHPPRSRQLADVTDADIASALAADYSLEADAAEGVTHPFWASDRVHSSSSGSSAADGGRSTSVVPRTKTTQPSSFARRVRASQSLTRSLAQNGWVTPSAASASSE